MNTTQDVGRNDPCPCGSGRKYKACCLGKKPAAEENRSKTRWVVIGIVALVVIAVVAKVISDRNDRAASPYAPLTDAPGMTPGGGFGGGLTPQPPGPAPAGKVWSPEHGHWHDAPGATPQLPQVFAPGASSGSGAPALVPQPPGPAPAGKVWSPEHGHWHDAPGAATGE